MERIRLRRLALRTLRRARDRRLLLGGWVRWRAATAHAVRDRARGRDGVALAAHAETLRKARDEAQARATAVATELERLRARVVQAAAVVASDVADRVALATERRDLTRAVARLEMEKAQLRQVASDREREARATLEQMLRLRRGHQALLQAAEKRMDELDAEKWSWAMRADRAEDEVKVQVGAAMERARASDARAAEFRRLADAAQTARAAAEANAERIRAAMEHERREREATESRLAKTRVRADGDVVAARVREDSHAAAVDVLRARLGAAEALLHEKNERLALAEARARRALDGPRSREVGTRGRARRTRAR